MMDLLDEFRFCPRCGNACFPKETPHMRKCENCGFEFYANPAVGAAGLIFNREGELLVVRRAKDPGKGSYDLPGGFVEIGETLEEGLKRELKEELGIEVQNLQYLFSLPNRYIYNGADLHPLDCFFKGELVPGGKIVLDESENAAYFFLNPEEIRPEDFGLLSIRTAISRLFPPQNK